MSRRVASQNDLALLEVATVSKAAVDVMKKQAWVSEKQTILIKSRAGPTAKKLHRHTLYRTKIFTTDSKLDKFFESK